MTENKVLATVNGKQITEMDVNALLQSVISQGNTNFDSEQGRKQILDELINQELFYLDALDNDFDKEEAFKKELELNKANILKQYALRKLLTSVKIEENEVVDYYNNNKESFKNPETVKASHILVKTEDEANKTMEEIKNGLSFEEAANKYSTCPSKARGGDLGFFAKGQMVPEFENAAFGMAKGEMSEPVKTQFGYHIIKLVDKKEATESSFEQVQDQIRQFILGKKQNSLYLEKTTELKSKYDVKINE